MRPAIDNHYQLSMVLWDRPDRKHWKRAYAHASKPNKARRVRPAHRDYYDA